MSNQNERLKEMLVKKVLEDFDAGKSVSAISRRTGAHHQKIREIIRQSGRPSARDRDRAIVEKQRDEVNRLTDEGKTLAEIEEAVGISSAKIRYLRKEHRHKQLADRDARIVELHEGGHSIQTIREHFNISYGTVRRALDRKATE